MYPASFYYQLGVLLANATNLASVDSLRYYGQPLETSSRFYQNYLFDVTQAALGLFKQFNFNDSELLQIQQGFFEESNPGYVSPSHVWEKILYESKKHDDYDYR